LIPVFIGIISGFLAAVMGVGGGFVVIPALIYLAGLPVNRAVGMSLFQMIFITAFLTYFHGTVNHGVDIILALILMIGSSFGAVFGSAVGHPEIYSVCVIVVSLVAGTIISMIAHRLKTVIEIYFEKRRFRRG